MKIVNAHKVIVQINRDGDVIEKTFLNWEEAKSFFDETPYYGAKNMLPVRVLVEE